MNYTNSCKSLFVYLVILCITGCAANTVPQKISFNAVYWHKNKTTDVKDVDCIVSVGINKYKINLPASLELTPKKKDILKVSCVKQGYSTLESPYYMQKPINLASAKFNEVFEYAAFDIFGLGTAFFTGPLAILFQEPKFILISLGAGVGDFIIGTIRAMPYPKGYGYRVGTMTVSLKPDELMESNDKPIIYNQNQ